jgi:hypothetical protein
MPFPGTVGRLSQVVVATTTTIDANADVLIVTGTNDIVNITPRVSGVGCQLVWIIPVSGEVDITAAGNVAVAVTCATDVAQPLIYTPYDSSWHPVTP